MVGEEVELVGSWELSDEVAGRGETAAHFDKAALDGKNTGELGGIRVGDNLVL